MVAFSRAKVAIVAHPNSGIAHYSYSLARALTQLPDLRHNYTLVVNKAYDCEQVVGLDVVKLFSKTRRLPFEIMSFVWFVISRRIDLVHFQNPLKYPVLTWWVIVLFRMLRKQVVYTAHDVLPHYAKTYHSFLMRKIYESANQVIVHSESNRSELLAFAPNAKAVEVIPHGIYDLFCSDECLTTQEARKKLGLPLDAKIMLFFGRIDERKGAAALVRELPAMLKKDPMLHVLMAGTVKFPEGHLESLAREGGVQNALTIIDKWIADDKVDIYFSAADVVILPYLEGSTSGVIKVAMAFQKPVIATRIGELPEMVESCHAGLLVDFPLTEIDVNKVATFITDQVREVEEAHHETDQDYEWPSIAVRTAHIYNRLLEQ